MTLEKFKEEISQLSTPWKWEEGLEEEYLEVFIYPDYMDKKHGHWFRLASMRIGPKELENMHLEEMLEAAKLINQRWQK